MRGLSWLFTILVTVLAVVFAVANREPVAVRLWPLPWAPLLPLYLVVLGSIFLGFLLGGLVAWFSGGKRRQRSRQTAHHARALARQLADLQQRQSATPGATAPLGIERARRVPVD